VKGYTTELVESMGRIASKLTLREKYQRIMRKKAEGFRQRKGLKRYTFLPQAKKIQAESPVRPRKWPDAPISEWRCLIIPSLQHRPEWA
jgi:hypothetical protein